MAIHFHELTVKDVCKETRDCVSISFDIPDNLKNAFAFSHGQNITIKFTAEEDIRRSYSICSSPFENEFRIAVKKVNGGAFSTFANEKLKTGDVLQVMPPTGSFYTKLDPNRGRQYILFAAGSGITPILSIIKTILHTEQESTVTLVYGNKNVSSIIFKDQLEALKDMYLRRFSIFYVLSREKKEAAINNGRIDDEKCRQFSRIIDYKNADEFFICGPEQMIFTVRDYLLEYGVGKEKIHFELFTTPARKKAGIHSKTENKPGQLSDITVKLDGRVFNFKLEHESNNILDAALAEGADLPYSCKGGVCTTCKSKLVEGEVIMEANYGLEPDEVDAGFILTCQSHPKSRKVVVDFDIKS